MKSKSYLIIIIILLTCGCANNKQANTSMNIHTIKISPRDAKNSINLSEIADSVKFIKLDTGNKDVLGRIRKIVIKKKYIYAIDIS